MPTSRFCLLNDRGVVRIAGADRTKLLEGLVTNSLERLGAEHPALHTGLLSPQGKILFDFFLIVAGDAYLVDIDASAAPDFIRRLTFYRLRANVTFEDMSATLAVGAVWPPLGAVPGGIIAYTDPRLPALGQRLVLPATRASEIPAAPASEADYHAHRIACGIPEAGRDFEIGDAFPHEALYDQTASVDFRKGCFIGQEVVSRMQHRGTARKRAIRVRLDGAASPGAPVVAGSATIGQVGSVGGKYAMAMLRLDRASEAGASGTSLAAGSATLTLDPPDWLAIDLSGRRPDTGQ